VALQRVVADGVDHDVPRLLLAPVPARHYWLGVAAHVLRLAADDAKLWLLRIRIGSLLYP